MVDWNDRFRAAVSEMSYSIPAVICFFSVYKHVYCAAEVDDNARTEPAALNAAHDFVLFLDILL